MDRGIPLADDLQAKRTADSSPRSAPETRQGSPSPRSEARTSAAPTITARDPQRPDQVHRWLQRAPSWLVSMILHLLLILWLGLWILPAGPRNDGRAVLEILPSGPGLEDGGSSALATFSAEAVSQTDNVVPDPLSQSVPKIDLYAAAEPVADAASEQQAAQKTLSPIDPDILFAGDFPTGGGLDGRRGDARGKMAAQRGGTPQSEQAVERGLRWLVAHQEPNGSWKFDHTGICGSQCKNPGSEASTTGATALALLPFLGAGYTHTQESEYRETIEKAIYYLGGRMLITPHGGDLQEGTMYAQGIATIALCEAYVMSKDPALKPYAESALKFVQYAQDKKGGGWRYTPGQPGDMTVFGWQLMALKSGLMADLNVQSPSLFLAEKFLDQVQTDAGAGYGYQTPKREPTTTAVGLLCRMYTGWRRDNDALRRGVEYLAKLGPSSDNMYFNYYATQVLHHFEGAPWYRWNDQMRDFLIRTQATTGHESGSWYFPGGHAETGGRLYNTCMAIMTLEVYYRYMPLYQTSVVDNF